MCSVLVFSQGGLVGLGMRLLWIEASIAISLCPSWALEACSIPHRHSR